MRTLNSNEVSEVSGGEWEITIDVGIVEGTFRGEETIQDLGAVAVDAYAGAVDVMADFFTWWDPANYYSSGCSGGGGGR